ncbi:glutamate racemase [Acanthopleuribacter pedis]|uniref:Glutamate racemase n=1 Tax=Acanthopleuribacter pedis TaxID=442870 RepID=A0A8J7Q4V7_9BACT|nr:glutamate racemase [Acanthopleuribacter pedis]MBO1319095.1 glutamate racemase [Acanthopleuribacter pedis]
MTAIGVFDSGIGGLTVLRALKQVLPEEPFIYLGDTARLPYGSKSPRTIRNYLHQNVAFLEGLGVKAVVVACNTASSVLDGEKVSGIPLYGVIEPGARAATAACPGGVVGVLATRATVASDAYRQALMRLNPEVQVVSQACPLLVPLVEEGWADDPVTEMVLQRYLAEPLHANVAALILGCTHYPVLKHVVQRLVGPHIQVIDSAQTTAQVVRDDLAAGRIPKSTNSGGIKVFTTDMSPAFRDLGARILAPYPIESWSLADL